MDTPTEQLAVFKTPLDPETKKHLGDIAWTAHSLLSENRGDCDGLSLLKVEAALELIGESFEAVQETFEDHWDSEIERHGLGLCTTPLATSIDIDLVPAWRMDGKHEPMLPDWGEFGFHWLECPDAIVGVG